LSGGAFYRDGTGQEDDGAFDKGKAEAVSFPGAGAVTLVELVENVFFGFFVHTAAGIAYRDLRVIVYGLQFQEYTAAGICKFDGIG